MVFTQLALREDSIIDFVLRNVSGTFRWVGVLLLDVSVETEIIDFLLLLNKQNLLENITITPKKCVLGIDYVQRLSQFVRVKLGACFVQGPFALDTATKTTIRGSFLRLTFLKKGGRGQGKMSQGRFSRQNR